MNVARALAAMGALGVLLAGAPAGASPHDLAAGSATPLEQAREASRITDPPRSRHDLPAGALRLSRSELLAGAGQELDISVTLERAVADGTLELTLPALWVRRSGVSGLRFARVPDSGSAAGAGARATRSGRVVRFSFGAAAGATAASFAITDVGIPAGRYELPFRWREAGRAGARTGVARVHVYAPMREAAEESADGDWRLLLRAANATNDTLDQSESFVTVVPGNRLRYVVGANVAPFMSLDGWITNTGGPPFAKTTVSPAFDAPGEPATEAGQLCCDPISAADAAGNIWYGGRARENGPGRPDRIVVTRAAPGATAFGPTTVALRTRTGGELDKPMMTLDNAPSSPTSGRLYVVWNEVDVTITIVMAQCDTRPDVTRCDDADNWSTPVAVTPTPGSYTYADVAVGPDGRVYAVWWDSSAANAIRGDTCDPAASDCASESGWGTPQTIATLDATGAKPVPGNCAIPAQPGGRAAPSPQVEVDRSAGPHSGRVYVTWSDLRTGSGSTRCAFNLATPNPIDGIAPASTHLTWDSFVASAAGALPGGPGRSPAVATRLLTDGEGGGQSNSDDWFPWLAVDQTTGLAWADFYSTRDALSRKTTHLYVRSVVPDSTSGHALGALRRVSTTPSDFSTNPCCMFGDDYGDYTGIDATQGYAIGVWTGRVDESDDGEAYVEVVTAPALTPAAVAFDESPAAGGDGDGALEPGESFRLTQALRNAGTAAATGVSSTLTAPAGSGVTLTQAASGYPDIAAGATGSNVAPFAGSLAAGVPCGAPITLSLRVTTASEPAVAAVAIPTACPAGAPPPAPAPAPPPPPPAADTSIFFALTGRTTQKPPTTKRGLVVTLSCPFEGCRVALSATLTIPARTSGGKARRLRLRSSTVQVTPAKRRTHTFTPSASQRRAITRALRSARTRRGVRVLVTGTARDAAGNTSRKTKAIRVRR